MILILKARRWRWNDRTIIRIALFQCLNERSSIAAQDQNAGYGPTSIQTLPIKDFQDLVDRRRPLSSLALNLPMEAAAITTDVCGMKERTNVVEANSDGAQRV